MRLNAHLGPDGEQYVTRAHAAELVGVSPKTISSWVTKGYLTPIDNCPPRRLLYRLDDVAEAEKRAHDAAVRTSGSEKRVVRSFAAA